ncbi:receptor-type tyrosine-protein phosphatase delta-like [Stegodyphus dumicola]|uniref:receptor-type tyrosine-protein phosphatase delta-like n=1 Tax=Stegodyphus dumicola TaxID=202533 RepID=UPI0015A880A3|nr:receptor-type tyrosine-protein phosphatase delta-like [Stegodyphus dumicola]
MAAFAYVSALVLIGFIHVKNSAAGDCKDSWDISADEDGRVRWSGVDRDAVVDVRLAAAGALSSQCSELNKLGTPFSTREVHFKSFCPNTEYQVNVTLICDKNKISSRVTKFGDPFPGLIPENVQVINTTNTSITLQWKEPTSLINSEVTYSVELVDTSSETTYVQNTSDVSCHIQNLRPYTLYSVRVRAYTHGVEGNWTEPITVRTDVGVPSAPTNVRISSVTNVSINIEWSEPQPFTGPILSYSIKKTNTETQVSEVISVQTTSYSITGLSPYTNYSVKVRASTSVGKGPWSDVYNILTKAGTPFRLGKIKVQNTTNTSIYLEWEAPEPFVGPVILYTIRWSKEQNSNWKTFNATEQSSSIEDLEPYTSYYIEIRANTEAGPGLWSSALEVKTDIGYPTAPINLTATEVTAKSITLSWQEPEPMNGPLLAYFIRWGLQNDSYVKYGKVKEKTYMASQLNPFTEYTFQVAAETEAGLGQWSSEVNVRTKVDRPSQPRNLTYSNVTSTTVSIEWTEPENPNGPILWYVVQWSKSPGEQSENSTEVTHYKISGLDPYAEYTVRVYAETEAGRGPESEALEIQTDVGIPNVPADLHPVEVTATNLTLIWSAPVPVPGPVIEYSVSWGIQGIQGISRISTNDTRYNAVGLRPYTKYFFEVTARTDAGSGPAAELVERTKESTPSQPRDLRAKVTHSSILLQWVIPEHPNGPTLLYIVRWKDGNVQLGSEETNGTSFKIEGLKDFTNYSLQVCAQSVAGRGQWTSILYVQTAKKDNTSALIWGLAVGLSGLCVILIVIAILMIRKKGGLKSPMISKTERVPKPTSLPEIRRLDPPVPLQVLSVESEPETPTVANFESHVNTLMRNGRLGFAREFEKLNKNNPQLPCTAAKMNENLTKNRWVKILPFDHSRVKLLSLGDETRSDFINASYIPGDSYMLEYIASQGPLPNTLDDFWTMVWQQSVSVIVMLTQCVERAKRTCEKYWPSSGENGRYGYIQVHTLSESILDSYVIRIFQIQNNSHSRHIVQMHFVNWPVSGCPRSPDDFLNFVRAIRDRVPTSKPGPILVHCSAGVGRTGTYIAVDRIAQHLQHSQDIDVYGTILEMRKYRTNMVQTEDQYIFIHSCIQQLIQGMIQPQEDVYETGIYSNA